VDSEALQALIERLPPAAVTTHPGEVSTRAHDRWALALIREARGERVPPPAAVVFAESTDHVATVVAWATETGTPVVARGGASGVRGAAQAVKRSVVLDLSRMDRVLEIEDISQTVSVQAGVRGIQLEAALRPKGLTVGMYPDSLEVSTVGGWIATAADGAGSFGYGDIGDALLGLTAVLPGGELLKLPAIPGMASGPDLRRVLTGSEGALAVITEATLAAWRAPSAHAWEPFRPHSFETGAALLKEVVQRGFRPLVIRLFDRQAAGESLSALGYEGALLIAGFDAAAPAVEAQRFELRELARSFGAVRIQTPDVAQHWWEHRHEGVARYDAVMGMERALGDGVILDTFGVSALWRRLPTVYDRVRSALLEHAGEVGCRVSSVHVSGASLRFSFLLRASTDREVERAYAKVWADAASACKAAGGALAHDGVGVLKASMLPDELGVSGVETLARLKHGIDPEGILNPGKLFREPRYDGLP
jgi:alkyldihydroxyacetonephosphate synthase